MKKICIYCEKEFETSDGRRKYCSLVCSSNAKKIHELWEDKKCLHCGSVIEVKNRADKYKKFCNNSCSAQFNGKLNQHSEESKKKTSLSMKKAWDEVRANRIDNPQKIAKQIECKFCGIAFSPDRKGRKYCSNSCRTQARGANSKGEISYRTWIKIAKRAFPDWCCPLCKENGIHWDIAFDIHHIAPRAKGGQDDVANLVLICPNHHRMAHLGLLTKEALEKYSIVQSYTEEDLLEKFYNGFNKSIQEDRNGIKKHT